MNTTQPDFELRIHCVDGPMASFVQHDALAIGRLLDQLHPSRIFAQGHLLITGDRSISIFPCKTITRVELLMDGCPSWPFHDGVSDILDITESEFLQRCWPELAGQRSVDESNVAYGEIELAGAEYVYLEVHFTPKQRPPFEETLFTGQLLSAPSLYSRRPGGGAVIVNPANVVRWSIYSGPRAVAPNALPAELLSGASRRPLGMAFPAAPHPERLRGVVR